VRSITSDARFLSLEGVGVFDDLVGPLLLVDEENAGSDKNEFDVGVSNLTFERCGGTITKS
jgi:hypothetical protein